MAQGLRLSDLLAPETAAVIEKRIERESEKLKLQIAALLHPALSEEFGCAEMEDVQPLLTVESVYAEEHLIYISPYVLIKQGKNFLRELEKEVNRMNIYARTFTFDFRLEKGAIRILMARTRTDFGTLQQKE